MVARMGFCSGPARAGKGAADIVAHPGDSRLRGNDGIISYAAVLGVIPAQAGISFIQPSAPPENRAR